MHTEEKAKQKWCPLIIERAGQSIDSLEGFDVVEGFATCIASDCMAWRWSNANRPERREGYCGLSGKASI